MTHYIFLYLIASLSDTEYIGLKPSLLYLPLNYFRTSVAAVALTSSYSLIDSTWNPLVNSYLCLFYGYHHGLYFLVFKWGSYQFYPNIPKSFVISLVTFCPGKPPPSFFPLTTRLILSSENVEVEDSYL